MDADHQTRCQKEHVQSASEWHLDGWLCDEWLSNLERGRFTPSMCNSIRGLVWRDQVVYLGRLDAGQLIRLDVSLSQSQRKEGSSERWQRHWVHSKGRLNLIKSKNTILRRREARNWRVKSVAKA